MHNIERRRKNARNFLSDLFLVVIVSPTLNIWTFLVITFTKFISMDPLRSYF